MDALELKDGRERDGGSETAECGHGQINNNSKIPQSTGWLLSTRKRELELGKLWPVNIEYPNYLGTYYVSYMPT